MRIIDQPDFMAQQVLGEQKIKENTVYRPLSYVRILSVDEGSLLYNILNGEMLLLDETEIKSFSQQDKVDNELVKTLIKKWFLVPIETSDLKLHQQFIDLVKCINNVYMAPKINSFTILPTTDCNARCFYCFELGCSRKWMSEQTAMDVVDYIMRKKADGKIKLRWFGGEPLYNFKIIDLICTELKNRGVEFTSTMVSNGYLFDEAMVEKSINLWKLDKIQITLDGTEKVYNKIKAYIYKEDKNPFKRVINNIDLLLKKEIDVNIRLNMHEQNVEDLFELTDFLLEKFSKYPTLYIYPHGLYENSCKFKYEGKEKYNINDKLVELMEKINKKLLKRSLYTRIIKFKNHCLADTDTSIMILPEGQLGKCEHFVDDHFIGSIHDDKVDFKMLNWFKEVTTVMSECDKCDMRPACIYISCCPSVAKKCNESEKKTKKYNLDSHIRYIYNLERKNRNETQI